MQSVLVAVVHWAKYNLGSWLALVLAGVAEPTLLLTFGYLEVLVKIGSPVL